MPKIWTEAKLKNFIASEIEESLTLEYKAADALDRSDYKKKEITKDVSAMANAAGGLLIYGIAESSGSDRRYLPEKITPVDRNKFPREWVEQIINQIRPRIDGIVIHAVNLDSGETDVAYVVEIPQSNTAHQASDHRYYKRFNFQSVPMEDYEVRDVMFREQTPNIVLSFLIEITSQLSVAPIGINKNGLTDSAFAAETPIYNLIVKAHNNGSAFAQYVAVLLDVPAQILPEIKNKINLTDGGNFYRQRLYNLNQEFGDENFKANFPLLGSMSMNWKIPLKEDFAELIGQKSELKWKLYADNAAPKEGRTSFDEIETVDLRKRETPTD